MFGRKTLPVILQTEVTECGLACLTMIGRYHGHDIDLNVLRKRHLISCLLYTSPSPRDGLLSRMPSSA